MTLTKSNFAPAVDIYELDEAYQIVLTMHGGACPEGLMLSYRRLTSKVITCMLAGGNY